jgi:DNA repair exonuclease SbcCD ATPase subunit
MSIKRIKEENKKKDEEIKRKDKEIKRIIKEKDEEIKRIIKEKDKEIKRKDEEIKSLLKEKNERKDEIYKINKGAWHDFVGEGFEIENGVLGLERDIYLSIVKFLDSSILRKV